MKVWERIGRPLVARDDELRFVGDALQALQSTLGYSNDPVYLFKARIRVIPVAVEQTECAANVFSVHSCQMMMLCDSVWQIATMCKRP